MVDKLCYEEDGGLALITLMDSPGGNRLNVDTLRSLTEAFIRAETSDGVRAVLLRSNGPVFCLGMDLGKLGGDADDAVEPIRLYSELLLRIYRSPLPVVCLVTGSVKAGGIGLVAASDLVLASTEADFQLSEVLLGLVPVNVLPFLLARRIMPARARELVLTSRLFSAEEAHVFGLVDRVLDPVKLERSVKAVLKMLFRAAPAALAETKRFTASLEGTTLEEQCASAQKALLKLTGSNEVRAAVAAFQNEDLPEWSVSFKAKNPLVFTK